MNESKKSAFYDDLRAWFETPLGQSVMGSEIAELKRSLPPHFGASLLHYSGCPVVAHPFGEKMVEFHAIGPTIAPGVSAVSDSCALPFAVNSMDYVWLSHALEYCDDPKQAISQAVHVATSHGYIILCVFNRNSLWGLCRALSWDLEPYQQGQFLTSSQLRLWLTQMECTILKHSTVLFRLPTAQTKRYHCAGFLEMLGRFSLPKFGAVHVIIAQKKRIPFVLMRDVWKEKRVLSKGRIIAPSQRGQCFNDNKSHDIY